MILQCLRIRNLQWHLLELECSETICSQVYSNCTSSSSWPIISPFPSFSRVCGCAGAGGWQICLGYFVFLWHLFPVSFGHLGLCQGKMLPQCWQWFGGGASFSARLSCFPRPRVWLCKTPLGPSPTQYVDSAVIEYYHVISCLNLEREGGLLKHLSVLRLHSFGQKRFSQNLIGRCSICWFVLIFMLIHTFIDFRLVFIWWYSFAAMLWCNPSTCRTSDIDDWHGLSNRKCFHLHPTSCTTSSVQIGLCTGFKMVASRLVGICWIGNVDPTPD